MKELRIATFTRGSTNKQTNRGKQKKATQSSKISLREVTVDDDLPLQKEMIRQFINTQPEQSKGVIWVPTDLEYVEAGVSGFHTHASKRKGLNQAFDDARAGLYDILIIYKLDRFGRRSVESLNHAIKFLKHCRIWVVDKNREFTNNGDADEIMNFIEFWSAKKASIDTKIRVTDAMKMIHNDGYWTGGNPPYGYINHPEISNMLQVVHDEAEVVKVIFRMYAIDGFGMLKIAGILNEQGKQTKLGNAWKSENIRKILRNTVYKGFLSYGKTITTEGEFGAYQKYTKEGEEAVSDKYWPEFDIVGAELWGRAQRIKNSRVTTDNLFGRKTPSRSRTGQGLLVGVLKCECGSNMTYSTSSNWLDHKRTKKGEPYGVYRCLKRLKSGVAACGAEKGMYKSQDIESVVASTIKSYIQDIITTGMLDDIKKKTVEANKDASSKLDAAKQDVERWAKAKENSNTELMKILMGEDSQFNKIQLTELYEKAARELDRATRVYAELDAVMKNDGADEVDVLRLQDLLNNWEDFFEGATQEIKRQMIRAIVSEIALKGKEITVEIAFDVAMYLESVSIINTENPHLQNCNSGSPHSS
ncbi:MAG: recombinase family protein [Defluviitaleaceae bacterium]|nr:recombinase family protein [Defluviitaleaceae bacterium]